MTTPQPAAETTPATTASPAGWLPEIAAFIAAFIGHLPALGAWWALDDWGQLARSAGLDTGEALSGMPARWLSQHLYWDLTWPLFGLNSDAHAVIRLVLHGVAAVLVVRIAKRAGLGSLSRLLAGLVFAASPLAFTPLYWASGIQELLAAVFALAAVNCWLGGTVGGRSRLAWATILAVLSILSKESGLGLPLLFLVFVWLRIGARIEDKAFAWAMIMLLLPVALAEGVLVTNHFATASGEAYATGGLTVILNNLGASGLWLVSPGPILTSRLVGWTPVAGGLVFVVWSVWGVVSWRRWGSATALLALVAALLIVAPALPLRTRLVPYLAYLAAAPVGLLFGTISSQLPFRGPARLSQLPGLALMTLVALGWGFFGMEARLDNRLKLGLVADPVARGTALSWQACQTMRNLQQRAVNSTGPDTLLTHLTLLQPVVENEALDQAEAFGERWTQPSDMYQALGGTLGPRLILGPDVQVNWANGLTTASSQAIVLCETATGFRTWGNTINALFYEALTDIGLGHFGRARAHLVRAAALGDKQFMFIFDAGQMIIPLQMVLDQKVAFVDWTLSLLDGSASQMEVGGLQDLFFNLLSSATGRSLEDLTAGSHLVRPATRPEPKPQRGSR